MVAPSDRRTVPARRTPPAGQASPIPTWRSSPNIAAQSAKPTPRRTKTRGRAAWRAVRTPNTWICNRHRVCHQRRDTTRIEVQPAPGCESPTVGRDRLGLGGDCRWQTCTGLHERFGSVPTSTSHIEPA
jgi:hypothetical protein